jgi:hypothetical protein
MRMQYTTTRFKINRKLYIGNGIMPRKGADKKTEYFYGDTKAL